MTTPLSPCPCGLFFEAVDEACKKNNFFCPAPQLNNPQIQCGKLLAQHPFKAQLVLQQGIYFSPYIYFLAFDGYSVSYFFSRSRC